MSYSVTQRQKKNGAYWQLNAKCKDPISGLWIQRNKTTTLEATKENKSKALEMARDFERIIQKELNPNIVFYSEMQVVDFWQKWLEERKSELRERTIRAYQTCIDRASPYFKQKGLKLNEVRPKDFKDLFKALQNRNLAARTIQQTKRVLHNSFQFAISEELITINPLDAIRSPNIGQTSKRFISQKEIESILFQLEDNKPVYLAVYLTYIYGLRREEITALEWKCIDFNNEILYICQTTEEDGTVIDKTKSQSSMRNYPLNEKVIHMLKEYKEIQDKERKRYSSKHKKEDFVFTIFRGYGKNHKEGRGRKMHASYLTKTFKAACKKADIQGYTFHSLRHACASEMFKKGFSATDIADYLGHSSPEITLRAYAHSNQTEKRKMVDSIFLV